jgi:hypothetical protein
MSLDRVSDRSSVSTFISSIFCSIIDDSPSTCSPHGDYLTGHGNQRSTRWSGIARAGPVGGASRSKTAVYSRRSVSPGRPVADNSARLMAPEPRLNYRAMV